MYVKTN